MPKLLVDTTIGTSYEIEYQDKDKVEIVEIGSLIKIITDKDFMHINKGAFLMAMPIADEPEEDETVPVPTKETFTVV